MPLFYPILSKSPAQCRELKYLASPGAGYKAREGTRLFFPRVRTYLRNSFLRPEKLAPAGRYFNKFFLGELERVYPGLPANFLLSAILSL